MINTKKQAFYTLFIVVGAALLLYDLAFESEEVYVKVIGLVVLMFGLYSSTRQWASDNDKNRKDDENQDDKVEDLDETENIEDKKS